MDPRNIKVCYYLCDQAMTRKSRGIGVYTHELISKLMTHPYLKLSALTSLDGPQIQGVENKILPIRTGSIPARLTMDHVHPLVLPQADIYHYPKGFMPFFSPKGAPRIASILDTIGVHYYDHYRDNNSVFKPFELEYWLAILARSLKQADAVITISHKSSECITTFCETHDIKPPPVFVTHLASKYREALSETSDSIKKDYVIHFASELPHKKTGWLLQVWKRAQEAGKDLPELRLVGKLNAPLQMMAETVPGIVVLPHMNDEELKLAIISARALIYPSEIEGFGLPALEAYQLGTPTLYVAGTSVEEIMNLNGEQIPGCFHFDDEDFWSVFDEIMTLPSEKLSRIQKKLFSTYNWNKTAEQTMAVYAMVLGK